MKARDFKATKTGHLVSVEDSNWAFVPDFLQAEIKISKGLFRLTSEADAELGRLCGLVERFEDPTLLFMNFMRREAILSSRIEGTHSTVAGVALVEATNAKAGGRDDKEVSNYVDALKLGMKRCQEIPIGRTMVRELHGCLMHKVARRWVVPGKEREDQVLVGGNTYQTARYVPPPAIYINDLMQNLEEFLRDESLPDLIRAAIAYYQFKAIQPFTDGNGRVGRILISTMLGSAGRLNVPVLYLSAYFD